MINIFFTVFFIPEDDFRKSDYFKIIELTKTCKILKRKNIFQTAVDSEIEIIEGTGTPA